MKIRGKTTPQHDLKGRMPERSEWLVAGGGAKRNPRYHASHRDEKNANIGNLGDNIRFSYNALALVYPASAYQKQKGASQ